VAQSECRTVVIRGAGGETAAGTLHVRMYSKKDRVLRALAMLGLFWLLAVLAIPLMGIHLILIPAFLVLGPIMAWRRYQMRERNEQVTGECPVCRRAMSLPLDSSDHLPMHTYCPPSGDPIRLIEEASVGGA
jgi:hypothetical protein